MLNIEWNTYPRALWKKGYERCWLSAARSVFSKDRSHEKWIVGGRESPRCDNNSNMRGITFRNSEIPKVKTLGTLGVGTFGE